MTAPPARWTRSPRTRSQACQRLAEQMLALALKAGADGAEVLVRDGTELEVKVRLGEPELVKEAGSRALGLRVIKDQRAAVTYTSDLAAAALERFARDSVELAALAEPDPPPSCRRARRWRARSPSWTCGTRACCRIDVAEAHPARARRRGGGAARFDKRVTNSDGAIFGRTVGATAFATSAGFSGGTAAPMCRSSVEPICDDADGKKRNGSYWTASRFAAGLADAEAVGLEAARRTVAKLGARKIATGEAPVIFSPDAARGLLGQLAGVISGGAIWRDRATWPTAKARRSRRRWSRSSTIRCCARGRARGRSTAKGWRAAPTCWSPRACCGRTCATSTRRASWGAGRPDRRRAASAAARTSRPRTSSCGRARTPAAELERIDRAASTSPT